MKKILSVLLAALLLCGTAFAATTPAGTFPVVEGEPETLTVLIAEDTLITDYEENAFTQYVEEGCNVNLDFTLLPAADSASKLQLMISAGDALPDVINYGLNLSTVYTYAMAGAIIPNDDLFEQFSVNVKAAFEQYPELQMREQVTAADGHMYALPRYFNEINNNYAFRYWINTSWLENLGLEMPTTTEEFYEVLKAFKEQDPNGNGKADEIPLIGAWPNNGSTYVLTVFLMQSFVNAPSGMNYLYLDDGKVTAAYAQEGWKEGLKYMNRLCNEGLIDPASFTQTSSQCLATLGNEEICIVGCYSVQGMKDAYQEQFNALMPLEGPTGLKQVYYKPTTTTNQWMITADCANPEVAYRVGDFMFNEDAFIRCRVGEEGVSWVPAEEGDVSAYGEDYACTFRWLDNGAMWVNAQNATWRQNAPLFAPIGLDAQALTDNITPAELVNKVAIKNYAEYKPADESVLTFLNYTEEEEFAINDIVSTVNTYAIECMVRFITGDMDIENEWDSYLSELDNMGLQTYLEAAQAAYDRQING